MKYKCTNTGHRLSILSVAVLWALSSRIVLRFVDYSTVCLLLSFIFSLLFLIIMKCCFSSINLYFNRRSSSEICLYNIKQLCAIFIYKKASIIGQEAPVLSLFIVVVVVNCRLCKEHQLFIN